MGSKSVAWLKTSGCEWELSPVQGFSFVGVLRTLGGWCPQREVRCTLGSSTPLAHCVTLVGVPWWAILWPKTVLYRYSSLTMEGLGCPSFEVIQDQNGLLYLLQQLQWKGTIANNMLTVLSAVQLVSGWCTLVLESVKIKLSQEQLDNMNGSMWLRINGTLSHNMKALNISWNNFH